MKVLIIEDDPGIVEAVALALKIRWPEAELISTELGEKGVEMVETEAPDMVILDLGLSDISGFDVLKEIRLFSTVPIVILTARTEESNIVKGLEWGADDYMVKPFKQLELLARLKAVVRRQQQPAEGESLVCGALRFSPGTRQLFCGDKEINLTGTEAQILHHLMKNAGRPVSHSSLAEAVWGNDYPDAADALKVHIRRLREKFEADPSHPQFILTKPGIGYLLAKP